MRILPVVAAVTAAFLVVACSSPINHKQKKAPLSRLMPFVRNMGKF